MKKNLVIKVLVFLFLIAIVFVSLSFVFHNSPFKYAIGITVELKNPNEQSDATMVIISKQHCINHHNYYVVREGNNKELDVAEEEIYLKPLTLSYDSVTLPPDTNQAVMSVEELHSTQNKKLPSPQEILGKEKANKLK